MTVALYPQEIQNLLETVQEYGGTDLWSDVLNGCTTERDRELTSALCSHDSADFVVLDGADLFLFTNNEQSNQWNVSHAGKPVYEVEPEMVGDETVNFDLFLAELQHELKGVEVKAGSALRNLRSEFVKTFKVELDAAFDRAVSNA